MLRVSFLFQPPSSNWLVKHGILCTSCVASFAGKNDLSLLAFPSNYVRGYVQCILRWPWPSRINKLLCAPSILVAIPLKTLHYFSLSNFVLPPHATCRFLRLCSMSCLFDVQPAQSGLHLGPDFLTCCLANRLSTICEWKSGSYDQ